MTVTVANTSNTSTFQYWLNRTNELADAMTTKAVTIDSNTATGNAAVNGTFTATTLTANTALRGGNSSTTTVLNVTSNLSINNTNILTVGNSTINSVLTSTSLSIGNSSVNATVNSSQLVVSTVTVNGSVFVGNSSQNVVINTSGISINNQLISVPTLINVQTSGTGSQVVDYFPLTSFRGAEYTISITDNGANAYQMSKLLIVHDTGNSQITDYGLLYTNGQLGLFTSTVNATSCILSISPYVPSTQVKATRTLIDI